MRGSTTFSKPHVLVCGIVKRHVYNYLKNAQRYQ